MRAVWGYVWAAVRRHRLQSVSVAVICFMGMALTSLAVTVFLRSTSAWEDGFRATNGAHLVMTFDAGVVTRAQVEATASVAGVEALGEVQESVTLPAAQGELHRTIQILGRSDAGGAVGRLNLVDGRWPSSPDEIAVNKVVLDEGRAHFGTGQDVAVATAGGLRLFRAVGQVDDLMAFDSFGSIQRGWVQPAVAAELAAPVARGDAARQWLAPYRVSGDVSDARLAATAAAIGGILPSGAVAKAPLYWSVSKSSSNWATQAFGAVVYVFMVAALLTVVFLVASIVAGSVLATRRDLGVGKALGLTPAQAVAAVIGQMLVPAALGALAGLPLGLASSAPFLSSSSDTLRVPVPSPVDLPMDVGLYAGMLGLVGLVALGPAVRAARVPAVVALRDGPEWGGHPSRLAAAVDRLGLPRAVRLGMVDVARRPVRSLLTLGAVAVGLAVLTLALTFAPAAASLAADRASWGGAQDFDVVRAPQATDAEVSAALAARPEIASTLQSATAQLAVRGRAQSIPLTGMRGDAPAFGYRALRGHWFAGPDEAVIAGGTAKDLDLRVGDTVTGTVAGRPFSARVSGIMNDIAGGGLGVRVPWPAFESIVPGAQPNQYQVRLGDAADTKRVIAALNEDDGALLQARPVIWGGYADGFLGILNSLVGGLATAIIVLAAAGVFNVAFLAVMERRRDHAILKALGMSARQFVAMVFSFGAVLTVCAALIGIPLGLWFEDYLLNAVMGSQWGFELPQGSLSPLTGLAIAAGGLAVALLGTAIPARRALRVPAAVVLHSE
ncbi:FtsX-like permease family protein [Sinomonas sp. R1AF57]|uniref:ABC transporter permease n=1 Tax=Sinomonas sp. R1AF57 TaxID=2020377 RepID=UPI000B60DE55|nr:FtsX-like permease family protein [Sinomonas sp. R1AF57]ASN52967.1 hypothetical protein CGQ25_13430 [Sinomonas sp. R1AF57]